MLNIVAKPQMLVVFLNMLDDECDHINFYWKHLEKPEAWQELQHMRFKVNEAILKIDS